jgi:hypothetical protein
MVSRKELLALLATLPPECEGCSAPLDGDTCAYCGRESKPADPILPNEPPDIRKTNASDDPCQMCGLVHTKDAYTPIKCRCIYCGQIDVVAMSTYDPILGNGVACVTCCRGAAPRNLVQDAAAAEARKAGGMPWES